MKAGTVGKLASGFSDFSCTWVVGQSEHLLPGYMGIMSVAYIDGPEHGQAGSTMDGGTTGIDWQTDG
jgi:hypothetical protein